MVTRPTKVIGGARSTGVFLTKDDFKQLLEVIAKSKAKDNLIKKAGVKTLGGDNAGLLDVPTIGSLSIRNFMEKLAKAYGMSVGVYYGINKHGEFMEWVDANEVTGRH